MKDIPGFEGLYAATSCGRIWSYRSKKFLKPELLCNGYERVCLIMADGTRFRKRVHTLIAMTYLENPYNYVEINHIDENKRNNSVGNLEWCDHKYNINCYWNKGGRRNGKGI